MDYGQKTTPTRGGLKEFPERRRRNRAVNAKAFDLADRARYTNCAASLCQHEMIME
jgi:hypothetical protein